MEKKKKKKIPVMDEILVWMELYKIGYGGTWKIVLQFKHISFPDFNEIFNLYISHLSKNLLITLIKILLSPVVLQFLKSR